MDDVRMYNRSLSQAEIQNLYELGNYHINWDAWEPQTMQDETYLTSTNRGKFIQIKNILNSNSTDVSPYVFSQNISAIGDSEGPVITLLTPQHSYNYSYNVSWINFTVEDTSGVDTCWYSTNSSVNITTNCSENITGITDYIEGKNNWTLYANDTLGQVTIEQMNFTIDLTNVSINATSPDNLTETDNATVNFTANASDVGGSGVRNVSLIITWLNGSNYHDGEISLTPGTPLQVISKTVDLVEGVFNWFISIFDWAGNQNFTDNRTITVDLTAPNYTSYITKVGPNYATLTNATLDPETIVYVNITVEDPNVSTATTGVDTVYLNYNYTMWDGTIGNDSILMDNLSNVYYANFTTVPYNATYQYYVRMNDSVGNINSTVNTTVYNYWDCTWNLSTNNLGSTGGFNDDLEIGTVTITNTGDYNYSVGNCNIGFTFDYSQTSGSPLGDFSIDYVIEAIDTTDGSEINGFEINDTSLTSFSMNVPVNSSSSFVVSAGFPESATVLDEDPALNITSNITDTADNWDTETITSNIIVTPGAYLGIEIESSSATYEYEDPTETELKTYLFVGNQINLSAYVKDVVSGALGANNTAWNVSFNWTLPSAVESLLSSGNLTNNYSVLNDTTKQYNNLVLDIDSSNIEDIALDEYDLNVSSLGYENSSGNLTLINHSEGHTAYDLFTIEFKCYSLGEDNYCPSGCSYEENVSTYDPDCEQEVISTPGSSSSGGGGGGGASGDKFSRSEGSFELLNGEDSEFYFTIENSENKTKIVGEIFPKGDNVEYITILSGKGKTLKGEGKLNITVRIDAPAYFNRGKHLIQFDVILKDAFGTSETVQKFMTLYIVELPREEADEYKDKAKEYLDWMESLNLSVEDFNEYLDQMNNNYNDVYYLGVKESFEKLEEIALSAEEFIELNSTLFEKINHAREFNIDVTETRKLYLLAKVIFNRGDYILAKQRINEAQSMYAYETKGEFGIVYYTKKNPLQALGAFFLFITTSLAGTYISRKTYLRRKIKLLEKEEKLLLQLMKVIQGYTFNDNKMSMGEYYEAMMQYEKKLSTTIQERIKTETTLISLSHFQKKHEALSMERKRLIGMMKILQEDYLVKGNIETRVYENMLKTYAHRLTEVQEQIAFIDTRKMLKKKNLKKFGGGKVAEGFDYS